MSDEDYRSPLEVCINCCHCEPSFNLFNCQLHGTKVRADEFCDLFYPKDDELNDRIEADYKKNAKLW